jgi:hypothetical protein
VIREVTEPQPECGPIGYAGAEIDLLAKATKLRVKLLPLLRLAIANKDLHDQGTPHRDVNAQRKSRLTAAFNYVLGFMGSGET